MSSEALVSGLETLATELSSGPPDQADTALADVEAELAVVRPDESALLARANAARRAGLVPPERSGEVDEFVRSAAGIETLRSGIISAGLVYVADQSLYAASDVAAEVESLIETEKQFLNETSQARPVLADLDVPGTVAVSVIDRPDRISKNDSKPIVLRLRNVGDEAVDSVSLTVTSDDPVTVSPSEVGIGTLSADGTTETEVTVGAEATGKATVKVTAATATDGAVDSRLVQVVVVGKANQISDAATALDRVCTSISDIKTRDEGLEDVTEALDRAEQALSDAAQAAGNGNETEADSELNHAMDALVKVLDEIVDEFDLEPNDEGSEDDESDDDDIEESDDENNSEHGGDLEDTQPKGIRTIRNSITVVISKINRARNSAV